MSEDTPAPSEQAYGLTMAGLIPFVTLSLAVAIIRMGDLAETAAVLLMLYALAILSFLGGIRWGAAITADPVDQKSLKLSVLPSLAAWLAPALILVTSTLNLSLFVFAGLFALQLFWDRLAWRSGKLPVWFGKSRWIASLGAIASLALAGLLLTPSPA